MKTPGLHQDAAVDWLLPRGLAVAGPVAEAAMDLLGVPGAPSSLSDGDTDDAQLPAGFAVALGSLTVVVAAALAAAVPASAGATRLGIVAGAVGLFAVLPVSAAPAFTVAGMAFAVFNGFLVSRFGELSWHGTADLRRVYLLVAVTAVGIGVGRGYRAFAQWRLWRARAAWVAAQPRESGSVLGENSTALGRLDGSAARRAEAPYRADLPWDEKEISGG